MLPNINLDDEHFSAIFEEARKMIHSIYPEWTDYNEHDPGITFLELFAFLKEMQQYHLNHIGEENLLKYLDLLDIEQIRRRPAKVSVEVLGIEEEVLLLKGSTLVASDIGFETLEDVRLRNVHILQLVAKAGPTTEVVEEHIIESGNFFKIPMFGTMPEAGNTFMVKIRESLTPNEHYSFYFKLSDDYPVKRNPIGDFDFMPLADFHFEYYSEGEWKRGQVAIDETYAFMQSGRVTFKVQETMTILDNGYWLRFRVDKPAYDVPPTLLALSTNVLTLEQKKTHAACVDMAYVPDKTYVVRDHLFKRGLKSIFYLKGDRYHLLDDDLWQMSRDGLSFTLKDDLNGIGHLKIAFYDAAFDNKRVFEMNGFPNQVIDLEDEELLYDAFEILIEDEVDKGTFRAWTKVNHFSASKPEDYHYVLDDTRGQIKFGNGEKSRCPEGKLIVVAYASSLGEGGNAKAGQINRLLGYDFELNLHNDENAYGGSNKEAIDKSFLRYQREFKIPSRAVTYEDYEYIIGHAPGLRIVNVKAIQGGDRFHKDLGISLVVQPYSLTERAKLSEAYILNIKRLLNQNRMVGTHVTIVSPEYIGASFYGEIVVKPHYLKAKDLIDQAVKKYFKEVGSIYGSNIPISELYGIVDGLACVQYVENISINVKGKKVLRNQKGDIQLPVNGLLYLEEADYYITST